jgi:hypothetical protein
MATPEHRWRARPWILPALTTLLVACLLEHRPRPGDVLPDGALPDGGMLVCADGLSECDGRCVDLRTDALHCGTCRRACAAGESCMGASCIPQCAADQTRCPAGCRDLESDRGNCGRCGVSCGPERVCVAGECVCPLGQRDCGGRCVNEMADAAHCGGCGMACPEGHLCTAGACTPSCEPGLTVCGSGCVDTRRDDLNCGRCGGMCRAEESCTNGVCLCAIEFTLCGSRCVDLARDANHCGGCDRPCAPMNVSAPLCVDRTCRFTACNPGYADCDGMPANGCETLLGTNANCSRCGEACGAGTSCQMGSCQ